MYLEMYISCYKVRNSPNLQINCEAPSLTAETDSKFSRLLRLIVKTLKEYPLNSLFSASSTSETPKKLKHQVSHDAAPAGGRVKKGRKTTEEEEGEIVSDPSDSESRRGEKRSRRYSYISNPEVEEKTSPVEPKEKGILDNI